MNDNSDMASQNAESDLQLDIDVMMLDYLLYNTNISLLEERRTLLEGRKTDPRRPRRIEGNLDAIDACLGIFRHRYSSDDFDQSLFFRLELLKLSIQFCYRLVQVPTTPSVPDLQALRNIHRQRSRKWRKSRNDGHVAPFGQSSSQFPLPRETLHQRRVDVLNKFSSPVSEHYGSEGCMSLIDLLPGFMLLTASRTQLYADFQIKEQLMYLAAEFMLQASLEACLCFGGSAVDVSQAFAWGFTPEDVVEGDEVWEGEAIVNTMFTEIPDEEMDGPGRHSSAAKLCEIEGWREISMEYLEKLRPKNDEDLPNHMLQVAVQFPVVDFETKVLSFLDALVRSIELPVLVQLEQGQLTGLSVKETNAFKRRVGLETWIVPV